ncbi:MAG: rhodanese-like domain-containing protein [Bacilli bacterium]|nr:rhodanese-like domain-containing protein [Bacilli bacterium]MCI9434680.1 rhodanese-like domain-containing protein [Bacilli bacterium]
MNKISISDLMLIIDQINIIDIRSIQSYNNNHIPNARNIPLEKLITQPEQYLNKMEKYYIYCQKGLSSENVCSILSNLGYNVISIDGGYENWILYK